MTTNTTQGMPPGVGYKSAQDRPGYKSEGQRRMEKQSKTIQQLNQMMPEGLKAQPVEYDEYGAAIIEDAPQQPQARPQAPTGPLAPEAFFSAQQPQQPAARQQAPAQTPRQEYRPQQPSRTAAHPIINKMLAKFGLKKAPKHNLELSTEDGTTFVYTMSVLADDIQLWAFHEAKAHYIVEGEHVAIAWYQLLVSCASVVAIDGENIWEIFPMELLPEEMETLSRDPHDLPARVRKHCARALAQFIWSDIQPIGIKLWEFYDGKISKTNVPLSSFDKEMEGAVRYVCPFDGCPEFLIQKPQVENDGSEKAWFCKQHAAQMVHTLDMGQEANAPLA